MQRQGGADEDGARTQTGGADRPREQHGDHRRVLCFRELHRVNDGPRIGLRHGVSPSHERIVDHPAMTVNSYRSGTTAGRTGWEDGRREQ
ncbi:hypothetical protein Q0Z83_098620 [Actinoplanes sichuanensis]|nr:hypothetical protein Q0Z83_098620 [Actinoplanes sichuanensis]